MSYVFISYDHDDSHYVHQLCEHLNKWGFTTWIDEDIERGSRWFKTITKAIEDCAAFIAIMTPEANESEWVETEILIAKKNSKTIFPILLRGEIFDLLLSLQCTMLRKEFNYLPSASFFRELAKVAPRTPNLTPEEMEAEEAKRALEAQNRRETGTLVITPSPSLEPDHAIYEEFERWERFAREGETDFYGIAMLALALEAEGLYSSHRLAMNHLWRACMIEPSIKDKKFMTMHYGWTEEQHKLLERILTDYRFNGGPIWRVR
jgi:hypothetical protein